MKIRRIAANSVLATSLILSSYPSFVLAASGSFTGTPSIKAALALSKIANEPQGSEALKNLLDDEDFALVVLSQLSEGSKFGAIQTLIRDQSNSVRGSELQSLITAQTRDLQNTKDNAELHSTLSELFAKQLELISSSEPSELGAFEITGLTQINEHVISGSNASSIKALAESEIQNLSQAVASSSSSAKALNQLIMNRPELAHSQRVVGSMALEYVVSQTEAGKQLALKTLQSVVGPDKIQEVTTTLTSIGNDIAGRAVNEKNLFMQQIENDPVFVAKIVSGLGTGILGVATGSPFLAITGVWGVFGNRIMAHIPINSMLLMVADGSMDVMKLASPEHRAAALDRMKLKLSSASGSVVEKVLSCGQAVGAKCNDIMKSVDSKSASANAEVVVRSLIEKGGDTLSSATTKFRTAISSPEAAELATKASAWGKLLSAQAAGGATKCWSALKSKSSDQK